MSVATIRRIVRNERENPWDPTSAEAIAWALRPRYRAAYLAAFAANSLYALDHALYPPFDFVDRRELVRRHMSTALSYLRMAVSR